MNQDLWLDITTLALLLAFAYLFYRVETSSIGNQKNAPDADALLDRTPKQARWFPYELIRQAGFRPQQIQALYWSGKTLIAILLPLLLFELGGKIPSWWMALSVSVGGFFAPDLWFMSRRRSRQREITTSLSFFINLMVVYLQSGMNLSQAFRQAADYGLQPRNPLAEEIRLLTLEIEAGRDRESAFALLADRTGVDELKRLAAVISVGFRVGSPLRETLRAQADLLKARQAQMATELVNRKSMEAMLPMMLVCFPMFIVLVLFPAVIQVFDVLGMIGDLF